MLNSPSLIHVHCVAHRLSLVCIDAVKKDQNLEMFKGTVNELYSFFSSSTTRLQSLEALQKVLDEPSIRLKHAVDVRWLAMHEAVRAVFQSYSSIVAALTEASLKRESCVKATALLASVQQYNFPAIAALLSDVLQVLSNLSKKFQSDQIDLTAIDPTVQVAIAQLEALSLRPLAGSASHDFAIRMGLHDKVYSYRGVELSQAEEQRLPFVSLKDDYIRNVCNGLKQRLINESVSDLKCFALVEPATVCAAALQAECLKIVERKFGNFIDVPVLGAEMLVVDSMKSGCYRHYTMQNFAKAVLLRHQHELPEVAKLCEIALCIPVSTAACERGFSLQNWLKDKHRNRLAENSLELLMKIVKGPPSADFSFKRAVKHWYEAKRRRQMRLFVPKKHKLQSEQTIQQLVGQESDADESE